ncbi:integral membrane protein [Streptomyces leeuwenhoekii]|uniref:Integral membrane protein n=1 Tax=Streptomyces leeuwenhoekii TaxID=1437453 RepID=A0ABR5HV84_STRLW|nr:integral membrane protein [Streptomyces leeuwenhoekii]KMS77485.1 integral membrane protein [Streptomyces leeuwenhoekii]
MGMFDDPNWPGLTFNPAKGDLHTIESLAYDVKTVGDELDELREMLVSIGKTDGAWEGEAAQKFQGKIGELPKYLQQGHESMTACSKALRTWHTQLEGMQRKARTLEDQAVEARKRLEQRNGAVDQVNGKITQSRFRQLTEQEAKALTEEADSASRAAKEAAAELERIIREGEALRKNWEEQAANAEKAIREASKNRPPDISVWDKITGGLKGAWDGFKDFLAEHADTLSKIGSVLSILSLATMAIPPVGAVFGALAIGASALALAGYGIKTARGGKVGVMDWVTAGLGVLPGVGAVKGLTAAGKAAKAAQQGKAMEGVFANAAQLPTSVNVARGMASGVMHNGLVRAGKAMGLSDEALDVGSWGMRGTMMGIKGVGLVYGLASGSSNTRTASAPSSNAFMTAAAGGA